MYAIRSYYAVIVGAIVLGPVYGGIFGGTMGIISMLEATFKGTGPVDLAFSPFYSGSPFSSVLMSVVVRIFIGVVAGLVFRAMIKSNVNSYISMVVAAFLATATNTVGVLSCLWLLFPSLGINFKIFIEAITSASRRPPVVRAHAPRPRRDRPCRAGSRNRRSGRTRCPRITSYNVCYTKLLRRR